MSDDLDELRALAADANVLPVTTELLGDSLTPVGAFRSVVGDGDGFLLESVEHGGRSARYSFLGRDPVKTGEPTETTEVERMEWVPLGDVPRLIDSGEIWNSGSLVGLLRLLARKAGG